MSFPRIAERVLLSPWAIRKDSLGSMLTQLHPHLAGLAPVPREARDAALDRQALFIEPGREAAWVQQHTDGRGICRIFGSGIMGKHLSGFDMLCGGLSYDQLALALRVAAADPGVRSILLHLDTPGGMVTGAPELAHVVQQVARQAKPVAAFVDSQCCSAGQMAIAGASHIYATPSSVVGSIGVYMALIDFSGWFEANGLKMEVFKGGRLKAMGVEGTSLTDEQRAFLQAEVDRDYKAFKSWIRENRGAIDDEAMQGQWMSAADGKAAGLVDDLVMDVGEALDDLAAGI